MKKLLVHAFLIVGSAFILGTGVIAQSPIRYRAQIPFDFQARGIQYAAGEYLLGSADPLAGRTMLAIRDAKGGKTRFLGQTRPGSDDKGSARMIFLISDGHYTLSEIITPDFGLTFHLPRANDGVGTILSSKVETVAVNLN